MIIHCGLCPLYRPKADTALHRRDVRFVPKRTFPLQLSGERLTMFMAIHRANGRFI
jgi:hypothetical protein